MSEAKTIYVVVWTNGYEINNVECAYTTEEAAKKFIGEDEATCRRSGYCIEEVELRE